MEQVIGQMRKRHKIFQGILPISLIKRPTDTDVVTIDKIVTVSAALTNLCDPVLAMEAVGAYHTCWLGEVESEAMKL